MGIRSIPSGNESEFVYHAPGILRKPERNFRKTIEKAASLEKVVGKGC